MRRPQIPPAPSSLNITSLCDIMLSLLIFFMLVSKAGLDTGADPDLALPVATLGITQEDLERERREGAVLVLNVDAEAGGAERNPRVYGKLFGSGREFAISVTNPTTNVPELREFVKAVKGDRDDFVVAIHAAGGTRFYDVQPVLQAVNAAAPAQVRFAFTAPR